MEWFSREEMDEITLLTTAWENSTNCKTCVGNSHAHTFFVWDNRETCLLLFCESSVAGLPILFTVK